MSVKLVFTIAAVLTFALGAAWLLAPAFMLQQWGITGNTAAAYMSRRCGGLFFGYAAILWFSRLAGVSPARDAIVTGGFVVSTVMAVVSLVGVVGGTIGPTAWGTVVIEALLAVAFGYLLLTKAR
jgi:hypothetical protein